MLEPNFEEADGLGIRDHSFKTSACLRGEGCPHVPIIQRSQYIRIKNPLHKRFAGIPMVGVGVKIVKNCRRLKWMVPNSLNIVTPNLEFIVCRTQ